MGLKTNIWSEKFCPNVENFKYRLINAGGYTYKTAVAGSISYGGDE